MSQAKKATALVDARTVKVGEVIDRGARGKIWPRVVVRVRKVEIDVPFLGKIRCTEIMHKWCMDFDNARTLATINIPHTGKVPVLLA